MRILNNLDLSKNELQNAVIQNLAAAPGDPKEGQIWYDAIEKVDKIWNGSKWAARNEYRLPTMSADIKGGATVGHGLEMEGDALNVAQALRTDIADSIKAAVYEDNKIKLYRVTGTAGTPAFTLDLPEEMFLDQAETRFIGNFAWSAETFPGSENPGLEGKPVLVLAVKGDAGNAYSFLDVSQLVDTYNGQDTSTIAITVSGYTITCTVRVSAEAGNLITVKSDGLHVSGAGYCRVVEGRIAAGQTTGTVTTPGKISQVMLLDAATYEVVMANITCNAARTQATISLATVHANDLTVIVTYIV